MEEGGEGGWRRNDSDIKEDGECEKEREKEGDRVGERGKSGKGHYHGALKR